MPSLAFEAFLIADLGGSEVRFPVRILGRVPEMLSDAVSRGTIALRQTQKTLLQRQSRLRTVRCLKSKSPMPKAICVLAIVLLPKIPLPHQSPPQWRPARRQRAGRMAVEPTAIQRGQQYKGDCNDRVTEFHRYAYSKGRQNNHRSTDPHPKR
jgi:hypothetical protein